MSHDTTPDRPNIIAAIRGALRMLEELEATGADEARIDEVVEVLGELIREHLGQWRH